MTNVLAMIEVYRRKPSFGLLLFILYTIPAFILTKLMRKLFSQD